MNMSSPFSSQGPWLISQDFKCSFDTPTMEYLGMIIGQGLVCMDPAKLLAIKEWHPPSSVKGVFSFLAFVNFYHKFIPNYSNIVMPIVLLTQKDHPWSWTDPQQTAFDSLHSIFLSVPVLCIPNVSHSFSLMTDASLLAAGAVLMQQDASGDLHPCAYFSKMFSAAERNYDIFDRELLAVILTLVEWKQYLQGTHAIEEIPLFREDSISHELVCLFHGITRVQHHLHSSLPERPLVDSHIPLHMSLVELPAHVFTTLHLRGFRAFISMLPPKTSYPTF